MRTLSVISSFRRAGVEARLGQRATDLCTRSGCWNCRAERFTLTVSAGCVGCCVLPLRRPGGRPRRAPSAPSGTIRPVSSASGMKSAGGRSGRASGCSQRTSASKPTTAPSSSGHDRLVVDAELVALDRAAQVGLQRQPLERAARSCRGRRSRTAPCRCALARYIARSASRRSSSASACAGAAQRDADADGGRTPRGRRGRTGSAARSGCGRRLGRPRLVRDVLEQDGELVAAEPGDRVLGAQAAASRRATVDQQLVANRVPEAVVDDLEVVEVDEEDGEGGLRVRGGGARDRSQAVAGRAPGWGGRSGRRGGPRGASCCLGALPLGDVRLRSGHARGRPPRLAYGERRGEHPAIRRRPRVRMRYSRSKCSVRPSGWPERRFTSCRSSGWMRSSHILRTCPRALGQPEHRRSSAARDTPGPDRSPSPRARRWRPRR